MPTKKVEFTNNVGYKLSTKLGLPMMLKPVAYAIFAHVFTGHKI